jgi:hypothetical protein
MLNNRWRLPVANLGQKHLAGSCVALRLILVPIQLVPGALSLGVKRPEPEADHSPPSSAEVKRMSGAITPLPNTPSWRAAQLRS